MTSSIILLLQLAHRNLVEQLQRNNLRVSGLLGNEPLKFKVCDSNLFILAPHVSTV